MHKIQLTKLIIEHLFLSPSSTCRTDSTYLLEPLSPSASIVHCFR